MGDAESALPPSKKRAAGREISRDNPGLDDDDDETTELEAGTFKKASDEVMANRRIVKVRRHQTSSTPADAPSSNPFAGIRLVSAATAPAEVTDKAEGVKLDKVEEKQETEGGKTDVNKEAQGETTEHDEQAENKIAAETEVISTVDKNSTDNEPEKLESDDKEPAEVDKTKDETKEDTAVSKTENEIGKDTESEKTKNEEDEKANGNEIADKNAETPLFSSFQQLCSGQNAFTGLAGTGFAGSTFSFGTISKDGSDPGSSDPPSFSFGNSNNGNVSLFGNSGTSSVVNKSEVTTGFPSKEEVSVETGEENEKRVFTADSALFEYLDGGWKERGKGEIKVNVSTTETKKARLVMRARGNYRLILNANLYPEMKMTNMDKKGITFACVNSAAETKEKLSTFALKFKDASFVEEFRAVVMEHKGETPTSLKTPENSPKASKV